MALFELDNGRLVPAQFGRDVQGGFSEAVINAVRGQILEVISRPLFPITWEDMTGDSQADQPPRLTALDAAGQVVGVEVVEELDAEGLIDALSKLADTAAMSWTSLAHQYPRGIRAFKEDWVKFREAMPTSPPNGPRMILVAASITDEVRPALDVLSSSGVEVHEMSLRQMRNGRAFLEVEPVGHRLYTHRFSPVLEGQEELPGLAAVATAGSSKPSRSEGSALEAPLAESRAKKARAAKVKADDDKPKTKTKAEDGDKTRSAKASAEKAPAAEAPSDETQPHKKPRFRPVTSSARIAAQPAPASEALPASPFPSRVAARGYAPQASPRRGLGQPTETLDVLARRGAHASPSKPTSTVHAAPSRVRKPQQDRPSRARVAQRRGTRGASPALQGDAGRKGLEVLGAMLGASTPLVLGEGMPTPAGAALTTAGEVLIPPHAFRDPTEALVFAGVEGVDGWDAWYIYDEHGPTLREALSEVQ